MLLPLTYGREGWYTEAQELTAYHEAGHAVVAHVLGLCFNHEEFCDEVKAIAKLSRSRFLRA